jgi:hypothetical protein
MFGIGKDHPLPPEPPPAEYSPDGTPIAGQPDSPDAGKKPKRGFWHRMFKRNK